MKAETYITKRSFKGGKYYNMNAITSDYYKSKKYAGVVFLPSTDTKVATVHIITEKTKKDVQNKINDLLNGKTVACGMSTFETNEDAKKYFDEIINV